MVEKYLLLEYLGKVSRFMTKALYAVASWERAPPRHVLLGRSSHQGEDELSLIQITAARENRLSLEHLTKDAPARISICTKTEAKQNKPTQLPTCQSRMYTDEVVVATPVDGTIA